MYDLAEQTSGQEKQRGLEAWKKCMDVSACQQRVWIQRRSIAEARANSSQPVEIQKDRTRLFMRNLPEFETPAIAPEWSAATLRKAMQAMSTKAGGARCLATCVRTKGPISAGMTSAETFAVSKWARTASVFWASGSKTGTGAGLSVAA